MMNVDSATFEALAGPAISDWVMRVTVVGSGFVQRALPLQVRVGDVVIEGLFFSGNQSGFIGYLTETPPDGAHLFVGYADQEPRDTGVIFHTDDIV